jgi:Domain of unknown function (DUF4907)
VPLNKIVVVIALSGYVFSCGPSVGNRNEIHAVGQSDSIRINTFQVNDGYGYEIYLNNTKVVYQPTIPVIEGNTNFPTKELAFETALLVSSKIRKGIIPPSILSEEMEILFRNHN